MLLHHFSGIRLGGVPQPKVESSFGGTQNDHLKKRGFRFPEKV
jgi:hypothetical protein